MIIAAPDLDRVFLKDTHIGGCLSRIKKLGLGALEQICDLSCVGCDAAHSLQVVESGSLTREKHTDISAHKTDLLALLNSVAILAVEDHLSIYIKKLEYPLEYLKSRDHAVLLTDEIDLACLIMGHHGIRCDVLACNILAKSL